jgi:HD-GYP domain-containing protein (c-di-GMP phosphodiesterase class II)
MKQSHLLSVQMSNLYQDPYNDDMLNSQFRSSKSLGAFLLNNKSIHKTLYNNITKQGHHYTVSQPLLTSILLLSFMQNLGSFNEKEIQNFFCVSYFRDIGMSLIPKEKYDTDKLTKEDEINLENHGKYSVEILKNRLSINLNYLNLINEHHFLDNERDTNIVAGVESTIFCIIDMIVAMISKRPYRDEMSLFEALGKIRDLIADDYPYEYKALVIYLKRFYS